MINKDQLLPIHKLGPYGFDTLKLSWLSKVIYKYTQGR